MPKKPPMKFPVKSDSLPGRKLPEIYTKSDSTIAREVVGIRKNKMAVGQAALNQELKLPSHKQYALKKLRATDSEKRATYMYNKELAASDTTMVKALSDVKADQRTPSPMNRDVQAAKIAVKKKTKK
jgi:hypothetical protein